MSRVLISKLSTPAVVAPTKVLFEAGSFITWNKTGDKVFVVLMCQSPNLHTIRSLPSADGIFHTYISNGENTEWKSRREKRAISRRNSSVRMPGG